jgi:four helix bundle protein
MGSFRELLVWRKAFALCLTVYRTSEAFPAHERFGISSELRKTARSVVYNIAEGHRRTTRREFSRFLDISLGSSAELVTQLLLARSLGYLAKDQAKLLLDAADEVSRMLFGLKFSIHPSSTL